ncbi:uncharacterized protein B0I36DRAFT_380894 [Microdochium trichocladiopsis]|uniref:Uncharacterized protein n=1 Tax=Microdochium trichocladiopsis TaxID=1682393 RepID=A0A9P9BU57_9PEZI|nr:uncharacterized protein B0I36DRAFT_380894 [Microdochium trichocladiopsis]KAH7037752.1 hypothetical protein B0I36DRAFT_380894 [Microdochium trichocladiopsis]
MPPHSTLEWIAGANIPRKGRARPRRRIVAEYETEDEDEEVEFFVKSRRKKKEVNEAEAKTATESKSKKSEKEAALKSALKQSAASSADTSDAAMSSDKDVETSGTESASAPEDHLKEFDPECPCRNCVRAHKALKRSRLRKNKKRVSFSDDEEDTDAPDDVETVHNFFKWNQAMEAKKARDQEAKDYKEFLADKAKKMEDAKKDAEKKEAEKKKEEEKKKKDTEAKDADSASGTSKGKQNKDKKKSAASSNETTDASDSEVSTSKDGTDADTSASGDSGEKGKSKSNSKAKDKSTSASPESDSSKGEDAAVIEMLMQKLLKAKKKKVKEKEKSKKKKEPLQESRQEDPGKPPGHAAASFDPNWLMPPRSNVVHVEHSMETPTDPRPNAFFDNQNRVMRVYHGPVYGNATGGLYRNASGNPSGNPNNYASIPQQQNLTNSSIYMQNNGQHLPNIQPSYQGYPPPQAQAMPSLPPEGGNQWFQGYGTTTVPGRPEDIQSTRRSQAAPEFTYDARIFDEAQKQPNATQPEGRTDYDMEAQMARELEEISARLQRSSNAGKQSHNMPSHHTAQNSNGNVMGSDFAAGQPRNSPNAAMASTPQKPTYETSWDTSGPTNMPASTNESWGSPTNNNGHSTPDWGNDNMKNASSGGSDWAKDNNNDATMNNGDGYGAGTTMHDGGPSKMQVSPNPTPGSWPSPANPPSGTNGEFETGGQTGQNWQDPKAASSSGGFWESGAADAGKAPDTW